MHYLVATDSARTTVAACEYLQKRVTPDDDVLFLTVVEDDGPDDPTDVLAAASDRLTTPTVETAVRNGTPADGIRAIVDEREVDELVIRGRRDGGTPGLGGTASTVLVEASVPVVVLPSP